MNVDMHLPKPRCRYISNENGEPVSWLIHGSGARVYGTRSFERTLEHWRQMMFSKILKGDATA